MTDFHTLIDSYQNCACGQAHECAIRDIEIGSGLVSEAGEILKKKTALAPGSCWRRTSRRLPLRTALRLPCPALPSCAISGRPSASRPCRTWRRSRGIFDRVDGVLAVGTGSVHDPCRLACARHNVPLCLFATAPSMDGFASYSAPIVNGNFKITYPAKCPEVIIGDTKILADAPAELKSAGFGDMISKYIALIDWQVSNLLTGESYCERVAALTRRATDQIFAMAGSVTKRNEKNGGGDLRIAASDRYRDELHQDLPPRQRHGAYHGPFLGVHGAAGRQNAQLPRRGRRRDDAHHAPVLRSTLPSAAGHGPSGGLQLG